MKEIPNLDVMFRDDLLKFAQEYEGNKSRAVAREFFPDRPRGYLGFTRDLGHYARNKYVATGLRLEGKVEAAQTYELICDRIWCGLPASAQW